ncbi:hypothetical protein [Streptomyces halobius]|uniref:Uncharacterized protein n=1 Tax=Streptomyces halobius TaxID=2879846 RepID=A0ABY4M100_9ACTN|nr:hypothetical protein [Streptomyces halobius]UQA91097.1 hypothetical protein K9S39_03650 [Streptomyces halobius]
MTAPAITGLSRPTLAGDAPPTAAEPQCGRAGDSAHRAAAVKTTGLHASSPAHGPGAT